MVTATKATNEANPVTQIATDPSVDRLIDVNEFGRIIGKKRRQIHALVTSGKLPKPVRIGSSIRWKLSVVRAFIEALN